MKLEIFENKQELALYFGDYLVELSKRKEPAFIALSGGSTPKAIFNVLASKYKHTINWDNLFFFWGDERCVPPNHIDSNFDMTREHLFDYVNTKSDHIFRVKGELTPKKAVEDYISNIKENVPFTNKLPEFDLMVLGMGDDGHTASIFPHQIGLWDSDQLCELAQHPESGQYRVTLTGKAINNSTQIFFLVTGENKAEKIKEIIKEEGNYKSYPASLVDKTKSIWLMDEEAAKLL